MAAYVAGRLQPHRLPPSVLVVDDREEGLAWSVRFDFSGQGVIVTGAARGIGRVMVRRFVESGASVVAADRDEPGLAETCGDLPAERITAIVADVSRGRGARRIVETAVKRCERLDVCVNNAAVAPHTACWRSEPRSGTASSP